MNELSEFYERAIRQAASLAFYLAVIERALDVAESMDQFCFLPTTIREQIALAETVSAEDLDRSRRLLRPQQK